MKVSDKVGLSMIKGSLKHMSKEKIQGLISIVISFEKENPESSKLLLEHAKTEWIKRKYDSKELEDYIILCRTE
jgi:hypothetical protein